MVQPVGLIVVVLAGWALGRSRPAINIPFLILAMFAAVTAHSGMQWGFLEGRVADVVGDPREGMSDVRLAMIGAGEAIGLWLPWLVVPWAAPIAARISVAVYMLATAVLSAAVFYYPIDLSILNDVIYTAGGPPYLFAVFACLPFAAVGFLAGWLQGKGDVPVFHRDDV